MSSGATTNRWSGGVDGTPYYMAFGSTSGSSYILSTTALIDEPTIDWIKARVNYRKMSSSDSGSVFIQLRVRTYTVNGSTCGSPARRTGSSTSFGVASYFTKTCAVGSTSWSYCTTSGMNPGSVATSDGGVEAQVKVTNNMFSHTGTRVHVGVDRTRVLVDY